MGPKGVNAKKEAGLAKKAENEAKKQLEVRKEQERQEAKVWEQGADVRGMTRADSAAAKADEIARKRREKEALMAAEEAENMGSSRIKKAVGEGMTSKTIKKKTPANDLSLLESTLVSDAEKKAKAQKKAEQDRVEQEKLALHSKEEKMAISIKDHRDSLLANTDAMLGDLTLGNDDQGNIGRRANVALGEENHFHGSGLDAALSAMSSVHKGGVVVDDQHPEKRMKALHMAFEEKMLPKMKEEYPGLRLSQYKEKIFAIWKKSPENPLNWPRADSA